MNFSCKSLNTDLGRWLEKKRFGVPLFHMQMFLPQFSWILEINFVEKTDSVDNAQLVLKRRRVFFIFIGTLHGPVLLFRLILFFSFSILLCCTGLRRNELITFCFTFVYYFLSFQIQLEKKDVK